MGGVRLGTRNDFDIYNNSFCIIKQQIKPQQPRMKQRRDPPRRVPGKEEATYITSKLLRQVAIYRSQISWGGLLWEKPPSGNSNLKYLSFRRLITRACHRASGQGKRSEQRVRARLLDEIQYITLYFCMSKLMLQGIGLATTMTHSFVCSVSQILAGDLE